jgi:hypothetical protein
MALRGGHRAQEPAAVLVGHRAPAEPAEEDMAAKRRRLGEGRQDESEDAPSIRGLLPGAQFLGVQQSGRATYEVEVQIQNVDLDKAFLCGYLKISGLTDEFPELTTYFEGEIIGCRHTFLTQKWEADETTDREVMHAGQASERVRACVRPPLTLLPPAFCRPTH